MCGLAGSRCGRGWRWFGDPVFSLPWLFVVVLAVGLQGGGRGGCFPPVLVFPVPVVVGGVLGLVGCCRDRVPRGRGRLWLFRCVVVVGVVAVMVFGCRSGQRLHSPSAGPPIGGYAESPV